MLKVCVRFGVILIGPVLRQAVGVLGVPGFNQVAAAVEEELGPRAVSDYFIISSPIEVASSPPCTVPLTTVRAIV